MTQHLIQTRDQLAELLTDHGVTEMDHSLPPFPVVVCLDGKHVTAVVGIDAFYPDDEAVISGISRTLEWYQRTFTGSETDPGNLNRLIGAQTYLARQRENIGRIVGRAQAERTAAEYRRRAFRDSLILAHRAQGETVKDAEAMARVETRKLDQEHTDSIEYHTRLRAIQDSVDATLTAVAQERKRMASDYERAHLTH